VNIVFGEGPRSSIATIIAALNEEEGIGLTLDELGLYVQKPRVLVVDGKSCDRTVKIAEDMGADVILQEGKGKGDAIACAIKHLGGVANQSKSRIEYVILTDADFTYPAKDIPRMLRILEEDPRVGMVCGNRFNSHLEMGAMRDMFYFGNRLLAYSHNMFNGVSLRDPLTGLRVIRWNILRDWVPRSKGFDIEVELNHHVERRGYSIQEIDIPYRPRLGEKKLKLRHGFTIIRRILMESTY
jgi:dolichol-phosphate mannosyltransferase